MNGTITKTVSLTLDWDNITLPLYQGTPVNADGIANDESVVGIVLDTYTEKPLMPSIYVAVAGAFCLAELNAASRLTWSDAAKEALPGVTFIDEDGTSEKPTKGVPASTSEDAGKVLTVDEDGVAEWADAAKELPAITAEDAGKVLTVDEDGEPGWADIAKELPAITEEDVGKVLAVGEGGTLVWADPTV